MYLSKVSIIALLAAVWANSAEAVLSFETVEIAPPVSAFIEKPDAEMANDVEEAMELHSLLHELPMVRDAQIQNEKMQSYYEKNQKSLEDMEACNQEQLSRLFKEPDQAWSKIKNALKVKESEAVALVGPAVELRPDGKYSDEEMNAAVTETFALWKGSADILTDVYAHPENWGEIKEGADSFPLWSDQKYWYDKEWDNKYAQLNAYFGVAETDRPLLEDKDKYDARHYEKVKEAHAVYLAALVEKYPDKARALPADLAAAPESAPSPLPPYNEIVTYPYGEERSMEIYPSMPEPWQKFIDSAGQDQNPVGEMAQVYGPDMTLKDEVLQGAVPLENRLHAYVQQSKQTDAFKKMASGISETTAAISEDFNNRLEKYGLNRPELNLTDFAVYSEVEKALNEKKEAFLMMAETRLKDTTPQDIEVDRAQNMLRFMGQTEYLKRLKSENPDYFNFLRQTVMTSQLETDLAVVKALRMDKKAEVEITETNAPDIESAIRQARLQKMQQDKQIKEGDAALETFLDRPMNEQCIFEDRDFDD